MEKIQFVPKHVKTRNVRDLDVMMDGLDLVAGEGCFGVLSGFAGLGKSHSVVLYAAQHGCVYMEVMRMYITSELEFLKGICRAICETLDKECPKFGRKGDAFLYAAKMLKTHRMTLFIDEMDLMAPWGVEVARDLTKMANATVILVGEEGLLSMMERNRRVWSRTFQHVVFRPIDEGDVMMYCQVSTGLSLTPQVAAVFLAASNGSFRVMKRDIIKLVQYANANNTRKVTKEMAEIVVSTGLRG